MEKQKQIVQGDILFIRLPFQGTQGHALDYMQSESPVIAEGEKTGHKHMLTSGLFNLFTGQAGFALSERGGVSDAFACLFVQEEATVSHEEHSPAVLEPGWWGIRRQRREDYKAATARIVDD